MPDVRARVAGPRESVGAGVTLAPYGFLSASVSRVKDSLAIVHRVELAPCTSTAVAFYRSRTTCAQAWVRCEPLNPVAAHVMVTCLACIARL